MHRSGVLGLPQFPVAAPLNGELAVVHENVIHTFCAPPSTVDLPLKPALPGRVIYLPAPLRVVRRSKRERPLHQPRPAVSPPWRPDAPPRGKLSFLVRALCKRPIPPEYACGSLFCRSARKRRPVRRSDRTGGRSWRCDLLTGSDSVVQTSRLCSGFD